MACVQNVSAALQASRQALQEREERLEADGLEAKKQQKAVMENLQAMRSERDSLADLNAKLEKQKERPIGVDASGTLSLAAISQLQIPNSFFLALSPTPSSLSPLCSLSIIRFSVWLQFR